ncbi:MAG TPA: tyrosine--tRNA ligase [Pirellulaceae bacterium]|jgi:tyrosyl-tRNA synthetase|nr:tyrosine--tRNA ligase [Pirellulaceae bacterium]
MTDILEELSWRGLIHQTTERNQLRDWLKGSVRTVYAGFDPTSDSLHVGNLMPLLMLRRFQKAGHRPIALVGGATGMIGDPSGKSAERNLLSEESLRANVAGIREQLSRFIDFEAGERSAVLLDNYDWMKDFSFLSFLRDVGKHFPVSAMMSRESVSARLEAESGLSYTEFSYQLLQAYDFAKLAREYGCGLQVGGSDQWGNIIAGIDLARRMNGASLHGLTCPLLLDSKGQKVGKTSDGQRVWLSAEKMSPYVFYQFWINSADEDAGRLLRFLTELTREEVEALDDSRTNEPHKRESQRRLAEELTRMVHGESGLASAQRATSIFFGAEIDDVSDAELLEIFADVPSQEIERGRIGDGLPLIEGFVAVGLAKSNSEARKAIEQGGVYVNNRRAEGIERSLTTGDLVGGSVIVLRKGKNKYGLLKFVG